MSKGSTQRPTDKAKFDANYDLIFKKNPVAKNSPTTGSGFHTEAKYSRKKKHKGSDDQSIT